jgi:hypothetical protein
MFEQQIELLKQDAENVITGAARTFRHLPEATSRLYGRERYVVVYADGSVPRFVYPFTQRPAALKVAKRRSGRYIWDTREDVVLDGDGEVVYRRPKS